MRIRKLATGLIFCIAPLIGSAAEPIKIAVTGPFSGSSSPMGLSMLAGVRLAIEEMNFGGGLFGRSLLLIERDDKADPATGKQVVEALIKQDKVVAGLGFANTGVALAAQKLYQDAKIPVINNVATGGNITRQFMPPEYPDNYIFRNAASDDIQTRMIIREAVERRKFKNFAIFHDTTAYGDLGSKQLIAELAKRQLKPVIIENFPLGTTDMTAALQRARSAGAEALLCYTIGPELAAIANGKAKIGWKIPMIGSWALSLPNFIENANKNAEGARMPQTFIESLNNYHRTAFISAYKNANKTTQIPSSVSAAQGYDSALILIAAMIQAGTTEGPKIRTALENLKKPIHGVITTYERPFTHDDHEAISENMVFMGEVKNGQIAFAYPEDERRSLLGQKKTQASAGK